MSFHEMDDLGFEAPAPLGLPARAISYDDVAAIKAFSDTYDIGYPMLSDANSEVIRRYGILSTEIPPGDLPAYG